MEDLYGGDSRSVLIGLRLAGVGEGELAVGRLGLRYTDVADGRERSQLMPVSVRGSADAALVARSVNAGAATEAVLVVTDGRHDQAVRAFESGDKAGALAALDTLRREVAAAHVQFKDPKLAKKLEALDLERADMDRAEHDPQYRAGYLKRSKEAFYSSTRGKRDKYLLDDGANGLDVENLQRKLAASGHYAGAIDGRYDADVHDAVAAFQRANNLVVDGIAGPRTLRALGLF